ncbi:MAG: hypothetical protein PHT07_05735 [Paludibacter sp.]|nr:hypothetical protein [Paludibacter sp.]
METNKSIEQVLDNLDKNIVNQTKGPIWLGFLYLIPGIVSLVVYSYFDWESTNVFPHVLFILGTVFLIIALIKFFFRKSRYVSAESNAKIQPFSIYFNVSEQTKLIRLLESGNLTELKTLKPSIVDGLKLRVLATKDGQICYSQVIAFVMNEYANVSAVQKHTTADYQILTEVVRSRK